MSNRIKRVLYLIIVCAAILSPMASTVSAQTGSFNQEEEKRAAQEVEACSKNLRLIYEAILAYQKDNKDIPNFLSDLIPKYLSDADALVCPVCKRTGKHESPSLADPKLPNCCYLYEFSSVPLDKKVTGGTVHTRREWKERQMALVGTMVPIVRCRQHGTVLNLAYDGRIYQSPGQWESLLTGHINIADLSSEHIFGASLSTPITSLSAPPSVPSTISGNSAAKFRPVDLAAFYNAMLTESWHGSAGNDLAALPSGLQTLAGVDWDIHGIVQLSGKGDKSKKFPPQVKGIKIGQKCQHLDFLHSAGYGHITDEGNEVGSFVVHYANRMQVEIPIHYGQDVRDWHSQANEPLPPADLTVAWTGDNAVSKRAGQKVRLFKTTWTNPYPDTEIESLDYVSKMTTVAPFLVAITAE